MRPIAYININQFFSFLLPDRYSIRFAITENILPFNIPNIAYTKSGETREQECVLYILIATRSLYKPLQFFN